MDLYRIGILLIFISIWIANPLFAQTQPRLDVEFRTDLDIRQSNSPFDSSDNQLVYLFKIHRAHLNLRGTFTPKMTYRMRVRWNESFEKQNDGTGVGLEYWYVESPWNEQLSFRIGKQFILQGGREGTYNSIDVLKYSLIGERIQELYEVGLSGIYDLTNLGYENHIIIFQLFNQPGGGNTQQTTPSVNFAWYGTLMNGLVEPVIQIGNFPHERDCTSANSSNRCGPEWSNFQPRNLLSLGVKINLDQFTLDLDFLTGEFEGINQENTRTTHVNNSLVIFIRQNISELDAQQGELYPFIKWIYDKSSQSSSTPQDIQKQQELHIGLEYFPILNNQKYRWHTMFISNQTSLKSHLYNEYKINTGLSARF